MIVLPIERMKQLMLELNQYDEKIREEDTNTWVLHEICVNYMKYVLIRI